MGACITKAISADSLCGVVGGGLEYVVGFDYDSFKNQYSAQHGSPLEHLKTIVSQSGAEYYSDLLAGLSSRGFSPIIQAPTQSATAILSGSTTKSVGSGIFADAATFNKKGYLHSIRVAVTQVGNYSLNIISANGGIASNVLVSASAISAGLLTFPVPNDFLEFDTLQISFAQNTNIFGYQKAKDFCLPCSGGVSKCPRLKDVSATGLSEFNGGNGIILGLSCSCDAECHLYKKIGISADVKSVFGLYIERRLRKESVYGRNLAIENYAELNGIRIKQLDKEIEAAINKQLVRIMPALKNEGNMCFTCGYGTISSFTNI